MTGQILEKSFKLKVLYTLTSLIRIYDNCVGMSAMSYLCQLYCHVVFMTSVSPCLHDSGCSAYRHPDTAGDRAATTAHASRDSSTLTSTSTTSEETSLKVSASSTRE